MLKWASMRLPRSIAVTKCCWQPRFLAPVHSSAPALSLHWRRLAAAMQQTDEPHKAVAALAPLFSRAKQPFVVMLAPIQVAGLSWLQWLGCFEFWLSSL